MPKQLDTPSQSSPAQLAQPTDSRERLLQAALRCFAEHGFEKTSTRMIAQAAGANLAAIRYYFGDKAGIYRAVFTEPIRKPQDEMAALLEPTLSLEQALNVLFTSFIEPLKQGELAQMCTKLHMREMIEPTGLWQEEIERGIAPYHQALIQVLCRHLGLADEDDDVHRLGFCIVAQAIYLYVGQDVMRAVRPQLIRDGHALDCMREALTRHALALVLGEQQRRSQVGMKVKT